jgi:hypothetical protein
LSHDREQPVADVVAQHVVDLLELVQVQQQHRDVVAVGGERVGDALTEVGTVRQRGERVVRGIVTELVHQPGAAQRHSEVAAQGLQHGEVVGGERRGVAEAVEDGHDADGLGTGDERGDERIAGAVAGQPSLRGAVPSTARHEPGFGLA